MKTEIVLTNPPEDDAFGIVPFPAIARFELNNEPWYADGAMAIKGKYLKIDEAQEIKDVPSPPLISEYHKYTPIKFVAFDRGNVVFKSTTEPSFYVTIQARYMTLIHAISDNCDLFAKSSLDAVSIEANIETEVDHECDCEFCYESFTTKKEKHLIGVIMPMRNLFSSDDIRKLEQMTL